MKIVLKPANRQLAQRLETERYILEPLGIASAIRLMLPWRSDPEILMGVLHAPAPMSALEWIRRAPVPNNVDRFAFAIVPKSIGVPIGMHAVRMLAERRARNTVAIANRDWWGAGVVLEVRARLMTHFFTHSDVERFVGSCNARNSASVFNYRRLGYDHVGTRLCAQRNPLTGAPIDVLDFEMEKERWLASPLAQGRRAP